VTALLVAKPLFQFGSRAALEKMVVAGMRFGRTEDDCVRDGVCEGVREREADAACEPVLVGLCDAVAVRDGVLVLNGVIVDVAVTEGVGVAEPLGVRPCDRVRVPVMEVLWLGVPVALDEREPVGVRV
jgi:hypothetical protein